VGCWYCGVVLFFGVLFGFEENIGQAIFASIVFVLAGVLYKLCDIHEAIVAATVDAANRR
jgi:hypothetical protein